MLARDGAPDILRTACRARVACRSADHMQAGCPFESTYRHQRTAWARISLGASRSSSVSSRFMQCGSQSRGRSESTRLLCLVLLSSVLGVMTPDAWGTRSRGCGRGSLPGGMSVDGRYRRRDR